MVDKILDLTKLNPEPKYICEDCGIHLLYYPQATEIVKFAGKPYICPQCHMLTDSTFGKMQHADDIKPINLSAPTFNMVKESKGLEIPPSHDGDPEPQEEEILKAKGATIISKRVEAKRD